MKHTRESILQILVDHQKVIRSYGVVRLGLFGSCARGEARDPSDLDFVVEFENVTFDDYMDLKFYLENLFDRSVDLVLPDTIKPRLKPIILSEAVYAKGF